MQVSHNTTALVALGSLASLASATVPTVQLTPAKPKTSKAAKPLSPRQKVSAALDAMSKGYELWRANELQEVAQEIEDVKAGLIEDADAPYLAMIEQIQAILLEDKERAWMLFNKTPKNKALTTAYTKASNEWEASKEAKKARSVR